MMQPERKGMKSKMAQKMPKMPKSMTKIMSYLPRGVSQTPKGNIGAHRAAEARTLGTFKGGKDYTSPFKEGKVRQAHEPFYSR